MPVFRVSNLNVSLPDDIVVGPGGIHTGITHLCCHFGGWTFCRWWPTNCHWWPSGFGCRWHWSDFCWPISNPGCGLISPYVVLDPGEQVIQPAVELEALKKLQADLELAMQAVEERGVELREQSRPQTKAQAEAMEAELKAALDELKKMKKDLE